MDGMDTSVLVEQLAAGFEALQEEYQSLFGRHQSLERKLATAREQYNELAKLCDSGVGAVSTPPLSLSSSPGQQKHDLDESSTVADILENRESRDAAGKVRAAVTAAQTLGRRSANTSAEGVKIWSGPSADRPERAGSSLMPSISESPLEQDFTIEGKPSRLGCPFASMANKKLSSHAASVLSRYNTRDSAAGGIIPSAPLSLVSRVNGKESLSRRESRRASFADPIKAEICGMSDHKDKVPEPIETQPEVVLPQQEEVDALQQHVEAEDAAEPGVCPIRFLDQHSPEEVATYFENHKHELPRSHEVCVRRYQSNEDQIRELDAKYGNLVSMIQGLGKKHKDYLPEDPDPEDAEHETAVEDARDNEKVRKWASSVRADAGEDEEVEVEEEERQPHFARPLRDIRVGESPSRPWGISVPAQYLEDVETREPSEPAQVGSSPAPPPLEKKDDKAQQGNDRPVGKCPFGFDQKAAPPPTTKAREVAEQPAELSSPPMVQRPTLKVQRPTFIAAKTQADGAEQPSVGRATPETAGSKMIFTGPVFIGYSAEDAAKILRESAR